MYQNTSMNDSQQSQQHIPTIMSDANDKNSTSTSDIITWVMRFVRYWYLFVISFSIAFYITNRENKKWVPTYQTRAMVMIEEGRGSGYGMGAAMQGFGVQAGYRNVNNQIIMFGSHDLVGKVIDKLPFTIDTYTKGKFKETNLYKQEPVTIVHDFLAPEAYSTEFQIKDLGDDRHYEVSWLRGETSIQQVGEYGKPLQCSLFFITVTKNERFYSGYKFFFRCYSREDLINNYSSRLSFDFVMKGASVINVSMQGSVAERDIDFINLLCETFIEQNLERKNQEATKTIDFIDNQLAIISDSLSTAEGNLKQFRINNQIVDLNSYTGTLISENRSFETSYAQFNLKKTYFKYLTDYLNNNTQDDIIALPTSIGISDASLNGFVQTYNEIQIKRGELGEKNPYYAKYTSQLQTLKSNMLEVVANMQKTLKIEEDDLLKRNEKVIAQIQQLPDKESQLSNYQRKFKIQDDYYTFLLKKQAESRIQKASNTPDNILLERARVMSVTNVDVKSKNKTLSFFIALLIPLMFVLLKYLLNTKVVEKRDVEKLSPYPYFGSIRHTNSKQKIPVQSNPRSGLAESFRVIRTRIEFLIKRQSPSVVLVTSTDSGDGKTTFSLNFAAMYAHTNRKTLLLDLDLRKPSVIDRLELPNDKKLGVTNYLIGQIEDWHDLIIRNEKYKFDIISGGSIPPNPGELIRSQKLTELLDILRKEYDHIVIDTSPMGLVADAYSLMFYADINLFIVRSAKTNRYFFSSILSQLETDKTPNVYIVLNDVDGKRVSYSNYHEYGRRPYYMRSDQYHTYTKDYFDEDEDSVEQTSRFKRWWKKFRKKED